jgi:mono/diheme cytochrome c family protein
MTSITRAGALLWIGLRVLVRQSASKSRGRDTGTGRFGRLADPGGCGDGTNPEPLTRRALTRGQSLYKSKCQRCHGATAPVTARGRSRSPRR